MRRFQRRIGYQDHLGIISRFDAPHPVTFFVEQISRNFNRQLGNDLGGAFLACFLTDYSQNGERQRFNAANIADARTAGAYQVARFSQ